MNKFFYAPLMTPLAKYIYSYIPLLYKACFAGHHSYIVLCWIKIKVQSFYSHTSYYCG